MRHLVSTMLVVVAVIHLLPLSGWFGPERLTALYGLPFDEPNLAILMRHRAVLFGLLGVFSLWLRSAPNGRGSRSSPASSACCRSCISRGAPAATTHRWPAS